MKFSEIILKVNDVFKDVFDDENLIINRKTSSNNIEDWDSLNHIILVVEIEKKLSIRFNSGEISTFKNVGEMCDAILKKQESDEF
tara:strand:+ start:193 stop:447 length:255 start_codon:yes stop_codon:yes gene_type:complete